MEPVPRDYPHVLLQLTSVDMQPLLDEDDEDIEWEDEEASEDSVPTDDLAGLTAMNNPDSNVSNHTNTRFFTSKTIGSDVTENGLSSAVHNCIRLSRKNSMESNCSYCRYDCMD